MQPELLTEIATRHQHYLEMRKTGIFKDYEPFLKKIAKTLRKNLLDVEITEFTRGRLNKLLSATNKDLMAIQNDYINNEFTPSSLELARYESDFEIKSLNKVVEYDFVIPTDGQLKSIVTTAPLSASGYQGQLLKPFMTGISEKAINNITNSIRLGAYQGLTTNEIIKSIIGTKSRRYADGKLIDLNRSVEAMVKTGLQHIAVQAREATWKQNKDIVKKVQFVATIDRRTSQTCRSLDGTKFALDDGPRPPMHPYCRSSMVAVLDERFSMLTDDATRSARNVEGKVTSIPADETYYQWLKRQPSSFQDSVIGKKRGELFRDGGLTSKRFAELQIGKNFEPITLEKMRELEPLAFNKIED